MITPPLLMPLRNAGPFSDQMPTFGAEMVPLLTMGPVKVAAVLTLMPLPVGEEPEIMPALLMPPLNGPRSKIEPVIVL